MARYCLSAVAATDANKRWQQEMSEFFVTDGDPDTTWRFLDEAFNLDDQLKAMEEGTGND